MAVISARKVAASTGQGRRGRSVPSDQAGDPLTNTRLKFAFVELDAPALWRERARRSSARVSIPA